MTRLPVDPAPVPRSSTAALSRALLCAGLLAGPVGCSSDDGPCDPDAPGTICTVAGNGVNGYGGDDGPALEARLSVPMDMAVSPDGDLWVLDFNNYLIRAIDGAGDIRIVVGNGLLGDSPPPELESVPSDQALFNHTPDLYFHDGYAYLAAWHNSRAKRVELSTMLLENFAGLGRRTYYTGDDGPALEASVDLPSSITADPDGNIVIMDQANQVIRRVDQDGTIHRIAGICLVDDVFACAPDQEPTACPDSNKWVCGSPETECARPCNPGYTGDGGPAVAARLALPYGQKADPSGRLAYDAVGNLYFADSENDRIRKIDTAGIITTVAGTGEDGYSGDGGPATEAQLDNPVDLEVAPDGTVYFADVSNSCIRKIDPAGIMSTVAGRCTPEPVDRGFSGDGGPPAEAQLNRPYGVELAGDKLYIADSFNHRIRVVNL